MKAPLKVFTMMADTRGSELSRFGCGNSKLGFGVTTYSRISGDPTTRHVSGMGLDTLAHPEGTCPGATKECSAICYATRITGDLIEYVYRRNGGPDVPPIPDETQILRIHVSGDFDSPVYIVNWIKRLRDRPDVTCWAYTRSWRVPELLPFLEVLRALPNVQLFASMDPSCEDVPPDGWRRAWIWRDEPNGEWPKEHRLEPEDFDSAIKGTWSRNMKVIELAETPAYVCPEETGHKKDCLACGYCFEGQKHDVVFLEHSGPKKVQP